MLVEIMNIVAGLVLAAGILASIHAIGKDIAKVAKMVRSTNHRSRVPSAGIGALKTSGCPPLVCI